MTVTGNRVPKDFFVTKGHGESDVTIHAGSYHLALRDAGIEMANIITYSSILPKIAHEVPRPKHITHGEVMECIQAVASCMYGETATAGLIYGWLWHRGKRYGGLVCEYHGSLPPDAVRGHLREMLNELHQHGYAHMTLKDIETHVETVTPEKRYGTALISLCFTSHKWQESS